MRRPALQKDRAPTDGRLCTGRALVRLSPRLQSGMTFETRPGIEGAGRGRTYSLAQRGDLEQGAKAQAEQGRASEEDEDEDGRSQSLRIDPVDECGGAIGCQTFKNGRLHRRRHHGRQRDTGNPCQTFRRRGLARAQAERGGPVSRTNRLERVIIGRSRAPTGRSASRRFQVRQPVRFWSRAPRRAQPM